MSLMPVYPIFRIYPDFHASRPLFKLLQTSSDSRLPSHLEVRKPIGVRTFIIRVHPNMKRRCEDVIVENRGPESLRAEDSNTITSKYMKPTTAQRRVPPSFLESKGAPLDIWVQISLQQVMESSAAGFTRMDMDTTEGLHFLVFLGAQGKEYIDVIRNMFPKHFDPLLFVSSNIDQRFSENPQFHCSDTETCKELARYFEIMDPLGGGDYPLNYLIVVDSDSLVRCKLPIRIGPYYSPHQKFGISLSQLESLIDEFLDFFMEHKITILM